jgi:hypothetical protein
MPATIDGSYFASRKPDFSLAFGQATYIGARWMASLARQHPDRRFITVSPGNTTGTQAPDGLPRPMRVAAKYVRPDPVQRGVLRQPGEQADGAIGQPGGDLARSGKPVVPGPRRRGHPPLRRLDGRDAAAGM